MEVDEPTKFPLKSNIFDYKYEKENRRVKNETPDEEDLLKDLLVTPQR